MRRSGRPIITYVDTLAYAADRPGETTTPGLWVLNKGGLPLSAGVLYEGDDPHDYAKAQADDFGWLYEWVHGVSWRINTTYLVAQMLVAVPVKGLVLREHPDAMQLRPEDAEPEPEHGPFEAPTVSLAGVLYHGACVANLEADRNKVARKALLDVLEWGPALEGFDKLPARLYGGPDFSIAR